jgi:hypothetical protein
VFLKKFYLNAFEQGSRCIHFDKGSTTCSLSNLSDHWGEFETVTSTE